MYNFKSEIIQINSDVWSYCLIVPKHISDHFTSTEDRRVVCTLNKVWTYQCALMPAGNGQYFINTNKETRKKLGLEVGSEVDVVIKKDESEYGSPMPVEFREAMDLDPDGDRLFHQLTAGKQRTLLHVIGKPKSAEIRIKKALVLLEYLRSVNGNLNFKELNEAFKAANN